MYPAGHFAAPASRSRCRLQPGTCYTPAGHFAAPASGGFPNAQRLRNVGYRREAGIADARVSKALSRLKTPRRLRAKSLAVTGSITLGGLVDVYTVGFKPAVGNSFRVLSDASESGTVTTDGTSLGGGVTLSIAATGNNITLKAIALPADSTPPTASGFIAGAIASGAALFTFTVTYADNVAIDLSTLGNGNITVTGPHGFTAAATYVSASKSNNGTPRTVTYSIVPPGGTWTKAANGAYTVTLKLSSVKDTHGNAVAGQVLGTFVVNLLV